MRILITGFVTLVLWSFLSTWLYVDILKPATKKQVVVQPAPENQNREADSLAKFYASMPKELKIFFDFDKSKMIPAPGADSSIAKFREWITIHPATTLLITGHTDFIGTPDYNRKLGIERAETVKKFLVEKGLPAEKMETFSAGGEESPGSQITSSERAENRRTEVTIKK
jgi:outer membrane protein OmpA-like peptidoglycan-associated protein